MSILFGPALVLASQSFEEGRAEILREVAKLEEPFTFDHVTEGWCICLWCCADWNPKETAHPDNGCLWPRAQAARAQGEP